MLKVLSIDELTNQEVSLIQEYLKDKTIAGPIEGLYWLPIPIKQLTPEQTQSLDKNGPFKVAIELGRTWLRFELLVRSEALDNSGGGSLNNEQFNFVVGFYNQIYSYLNGSI